MHARGPAGPGLLLIVLGVILFTFAAISAPGGNFSLAGPASPAGTLLFSLLALALIGAGAYATIHRSGIHTLPVNPALAATIRRELRKGLSEAQIRSQLAQRRWDMEEVDAAMEQARERA